MNKKYVLLVLMIFILMSCISQSVKKTKSESIAKKNIKEEYFGNGKIKSRVKLKNGVEHGSYYKFYENGILAESGVKIKGKMNGLWKYYDSLGQITLAKHYYNDSLIYDLNTDDFNFVKKRIGDFIEVEIPEKWKIIKEVNSKQVLLSIRKDCNKSMSFCPSLTITYEKSIPVGLGIDDYLKKSNDILSSSLNNYKVIKERKYLDEGKVYYEKIYTGNVHNIKIGVITTWIFDEKKTYIITGMALNEKGNSFLKQEGLFKDITNKVKIN